MIDERIALLLRVRDRWNAGDLDGYLDLYDEDVVLHGHAGIEPGFEGVRKFYESFFAAFPGSCLEFEDVFGAEDKVTCRFSVQGHHGGPFQGIPPTHKDFHLHGITVLRFDGTKCVERWSQADFLSLLQQLGVIPS